MTEIEFTYPDEQIEKKYKWLKELASTYDNEQVTVKII
jgi:hypothetical protein